MLEWNNNKCMAKKNQRSNDICLRRTKDGEDFCQYHKKSKKYHGDFLKKRRNNFIKELRLDKKDINKEINNIKKYFFVEDIAERLFSKLDENTKLLNSNFNYTLMDLHDSWNEIDNVSRIKLADIWWDIDILIMHFSQQLNYSKMENPYPIYPSNPFNRNIISVNDLIKFGKRITKLNKSVNIALNEFLKCDKDILEIFYNEAVNSYEGNSPSVLSMLTNKYRYKLVNNKDSQGCYVGYWVSKKEQKSEFESMYNELQITPYQIFSQIHRNIISNPRRDWLQRRLNLFEEEPVNLFG